MKKFYIILFMFFVNCFMFAQSNQPLISGIFNCYKQSVSNGTQQLSQNTASAYFSSSPTTYINPMNAVKAGKVELNNIKLDFIDQKFYGDNTNCLNLNQMHWEVKGHQQVPAMNFLYTGGFPSFQLNGCLNDSIKKSDTLFLRFNFINQADSIYVTIIKSENPNGIDYTQFIPVSFHFKASDTLYAITPNTLTSLQIGNRFSFKIEAVKTSYQMVGGKTYQFNNYFSVLNPQVKIRP